MRIIDADTLKAEFTGNFQEMWHYTGIWAMIDVAPTIDAEPVKHGRWEEMHYEGGILNGTNFDKCSECGYERVFEDKNLKTIFRFCPNCGAKMDSEGSEK